MEQEEQVFRGTPPMETKRTILRWLKPEDAEDVFAYAQSPDVTAYMSWDLHASIRDTQVFIQQCMSDVDEDRAGIWGIVWKKTGRVIGTIRFVSVDTANRSAPVAYVLSEVYWGQGIATEVLEKILEFGFDSMGLNRIEGIHMLRNEVSGRVLEKAGMRYEGLIREKLRAKGTYWDVQQYAILKRDWDLRRTARVKGLRK